MLLTAFILGLMGSWHCIAMCGPIALMIPKGKSGKTFLPLLLYHGGKILAYALVGIAMGSLALFFTSFDFQSVLLIAAGSLMIVVALFPILFNKMEAQGSRFFRPLVRVKTKLTAALNKENIEFSFYVGFLNGFIPCGMVYLAGIGAMAQPTFVEGILFMVFFGLGTFPFMSILILASQYFKTRFVKHANSLRMVGLLLVGIFMLYRGYASFNHDLTQEEIKGKAFHVCY